MFRVHAWLLSMLLLAANLSFASSYRPDARRGDDPVAYFTYRNEQVIRQRATEKELKKGGGTFIQGMQSILDACYTRLQASSDGPILVPGQLYEFDLLSQQVHAARPKWSTLAHEQEFAFYQREDRRRENERAAAAALKARIAARARRTADSLQQIVLERRRKIVTDSLEKVAEQQAIVEEEETRQAEKAYEDSVYFSHPGIVELDRRDGFRGLKFGSTVGELSKQARRLKIIDQDIHVYEVPGQTTLQLGRAKVTSVRYGFYRGHLIHVEMHLDGADNRDNMMALLKTAYGEPEMVDAFEEEDEEKAAQWKGRQVLLRLEPEDSGYSVVFISVRIMDVRSLMNFIKQNEAAKKL